LVCGGGVSCFKGAGKTKNRKKTAGAHRRTRGGGEVTEGFKGKLNLCRGTSTDAVMNKSVTQG